MKNRSRKALIALALLAGLATLGYLLAPLGEGTWNMKRVTIEDAGRRNRYRLEADPGSGPTWAIELRIRGRLEGDAVVRLAPPGGEVLVRQVLRAGEVDTRYRGDWYAGTCELLYEPEAGTRGALTVYYAFSHLQ